MSSYLLAAAIVTPCVSAQAVFTPVLRSGDALPGGEVVLDVLGVVPDRSGSGWAATVRARASRRQYVIADPVDAPGSTLQVRYTSGPNPIALGLFPTDMFGGRVAWQHFNTQGITSGAFVDGVRYSGNGVPGPFPGADWFNPPTLRMTSQGDLIAYGAYTQVGGAPGSVAVNVTTSQILIRTGDPLSGTSATVSFGPSGPGPDAWFSPSLNGQHWIAGMTVSTGQFAVFADGRQLDLLGTSLRQGEQGSLGLLNVLQRTNAQLGFIGSSSTIDDEGRWLTSLGVSGYNASGGTLSDFINFKLLASHRGVVGGFVTVWRSPIAYTPLGAELWAEGGPSLASFGTTAGPLAGPRVVVDVDGDGVVDPGWSVTFHDRRPFEGLDSRGFLYVRATLLDLVNGTSEYAIGRLSLPLPGLRSCDGVPNSTGLPAGLSLYGGARTSANDLTLVGRDLPSGSFGLALTSRMQALLPGAGGSLGTLCLGGAIGRFAADIFSVPLSGAALVRLDLGALPTSNALVAAQPGETWTFQLWYRDTVGGRPVSNFSSAVAVDFE